MALLLTPKTMRFLIRESRMQSQKLHDLKRGLKVQSGWAIITGLSQDNLVSSIIIANSLAITTRPSQDNIVILMTIANSLAIITSFTGK